MNEKNTVTTDRSPIITLSGTLDLIKDQVVGILLHLYFTDYEYIYPNLIRRAENKKKPEEVLVDYRSKENNFIISYDNAAKFFPESFKVLFIEMKDVPDEAAMLILLENYEYVITDVYSKEEMAEKIVYNWGLWDTGRECQKDALDQIYFREFLKTSPLISILGQTGCGKATQRTPLLTATTKLLGIKKPYFVDTGEEFRTGVKKMTPFNRKRIEVVQASGNLQTATAASVLWGYKFYHFYNGGPVFVDGSPRSKQEIQAFLDIYQKHAGLEIIIIHITITDDEARKRANERNTHIVAKGGTARTDTDNAKSLRRKLLYYPRKVLPTLKKLEGKPGITIINVDGMGSKEKVAEAIFKSLIHHYLTKRKIV